MIDLSKYGVKPVNEQIPYPTFLYWGPAKTGKTAAALTHEDPLVFDFDKGTYELGVLPAGQGRVDAARGFPILDVSGDISIFMSVFENMRRDGFFSMPVQGIGSLIVDTSTRIYEAIKAEYQDEKERHSNKPNDSLFDQKIRLDEFGLVKSPLRSMMTTLMYAPYVKVHVMQDAMVFKKNAKGQMETDGTTTFKGEAGIIYDASVIVRTFVDKGKFKGEVIYDRTLTYRPGTIIDNPGWGHWKDFYRRGGVEDPRQATIRPEGDVGDRTITAKVDALMNDPEVLDLFKRAGIPEDAWRTSCENYNGDRHMVVGKLKARLDAIPNQPE